LYRNAISGQGNPTRSIEVNALVKSVQKRRKFGKQGHHNDSTFDDNTPSMTRRSMMIDEFKATIIMNNDDIIRRYGIPSFLRYQFHMIARIDDTTQFLMENLTAHQISTLLYKVN
jgi:hypothetical protein